MLAKAIRRAHGLGPSFLRRLLLVVRKIVLLAVSPSPMNVLSIIVVVFPWWVIVPFIVETEVVLVVALVVTRESVLLVVRITLAPARLHEVFIRSASLSKRGASTNAVVLLTRLLEAVLSVRFTFLAPRFVGASSSVFQLACSLLNRWASKVLPSLRGRGGVPLLLYVV